MKFIVVGYILVAVYIHPDGEVAGEALDYYSNFQDCHNASIENKLFADPGVGFVCLEDAVEEH